MAPANLADGWMGTADGLTRALWRELKAGGLRAERMKTLLNNTRPPRTLIIMTSAPSPPGKEFAGSAG
jgi:hypothetical protein